MNNEASSLDLEGARKDPAAVFAHPEQVLQHPDLNEAQKIEILKRWEYDARELAVAEEEGMGSGEPSMLARVHRALAELEDDDSPEAGPSKHGGG